MSALFPALLISIWAGACFFIFVKVLLDTCLQKKRAFCEFLFFRLLSGILWGLLFSNLHVVCDAVFSVGAGFTLGHLRGVY